MSTNMQTISFTVEPDLFNQVLEKVDALAIEQKSSRSEIIRQLLYNYFGIVPGSKSYNCSRSIKRRKLQR